MSEVSTVTQIEWMLGKTFDAIFGGTKEDEEIRFRGEHGEIEFFHSQDCCEHVRIEDVCGDLSDLIGRPIVQAEEVENHPEDTSWGTRTWTFYKFATTKGSVTVRWLGESNGYYSESVSWRVKEVDQ